MGMLMLIPRAMEGTHQSFLRTMTRIILSTYSCSHWQNLSKMDTIVLCSCMDKLEVAKLTHSLVLPIFLTVIMISGACAQGLLICCLIKEDRGPLSMFLPWRFILMIAMIYCKTKCKLESQDLVKAQKRLPLDIKVVLLRVMLVASGFLLSKMESGLITSLIFLQKVKKIQSLIIKRSYST